MLTQEPTDTQKFEILLLEMELIQGTFDKYDSLIFQTRNWFATVWLASIGFAFSARRPDFATLAFVACVLFCFLEGLARHEYWYKYVHRYRALREYLNSPDKIAKISLYDLTNHYGTPQSATDRFVRSFLKREPLIVYCVLGLATLFVRALVPV